MLSNKNLSTTMKSKLDNILGLLVVTKGETQKKLALELLYFCGMKYNDHSSVNKAWPDWCIGV